MKRSAWGVVGLVCLAALGLSGAARGQPTKLQASHEVVDDGLGFADRGSSEVRLFLDGPPQELAQVQCVEYELPAGFPDPIHTTCTRGSAGHPFEVGVTAWEGFPVVIRVTLLDGAILMLEDEVVLPAHARGRAGGPRG